MNSCLKSVIRQVDNIGIYAHFNGQIFVELLVDWNFRLGGIGEDLDLVEVDSRPRFKHSHSASLTPGSSHPEPCSGLLLVYFARHEYRSPRKAVSEPDRWGRHAYVFRGDPREVTFPREGVGLDMLIHDLRISSSLILPRLNSESP